MKNFKESLKQFEELAYSLHADTLRELTKNIRYLMKDVSISTWLFGLTCLTLLETVSQNGWVWGFILRCMAYIAN